MLLPSRRYEKARLHAILRGSPRITERERASKTACCKEEKKKASEVDIADDHPRASAGRRPPSKLTILINIKSSMCL